MKELENQIAQPDFWDDPSRAEKVMPELTALKDEVHLFVELSKDAEDLKVLCELGRKQMTLRQPRRWLLLW